MKLEMHLHSNYSDGRMSVFEIAKRVKELELDGFALTDHNTVKGNKEGKKAARKFGLEFIPGIEISTEKGHIIGLGVKKNIEKGLSIEETIKQIKDADGITVATHPYDPFRKGIGNNIKKFDFDYIESFNSRAYFPWYNTKASEMAKKLKIPEIAGSDAHSLKGIGFAITETNSLKEFYEGKAKIGKTKWVGTPEITLDAIKRKLIKYSNPDNLPF